MPITGARASTCKQRSRGQVQTVPRFSHPGRCDSCREKPPAMCLACGPVSPCGGLGCRGAGLVSRASGGCETSGAWAQIWPTSPALHVVKAGPRRGQARRGGAAAGRSCGPTAKGAVGGGAAVFPPAQQGTARSPQVCFREGRDGSM